MAGQMRDIAQQFSVQTQVNELGTACAVEAGGERSVSKIEGTEKALFGTSPLEGHHRPRHV